MLLPVESLPPVHLSAQLVWYFCPPPPPLEFNPIHPEALVIDLSHDDPTALQNHPVQDLRRDGEPDIGEGSRGVVLHQRQVSVCVAIYLMVD